MNVLLLSQFFSTTRGGGEYEFSLIAKNLANNGHNVWVITNKIGDESYESHENIKLIFVKPDLEYKGGLPPSFSDNMRYCINTIRTGLKLIKHEKIEIIHSNNFSPALAGSVLSYLTSKPHITSVWDIFSLCGNDYWDRWARQTKVSKIHALLGPYFEKLIIKFPHNAIHTISDASKNDLIEFGATKPIYMILPSIQSLHRRDIDVESTQFVYVGRLVFYKNIEVIIKSINIAKKVEPKIKLVIVGDGPHRKTLEVLTKELGLENNVEFKGYVNTDEKLKLIARSSALLFPSLCEGFGLVILEAFSQERPVLVSNIKPMSDIVTHGNNGYVLDPHDEDIWAEHLVKITENPSEASTMGKNGNKLLAESYDQRSMYLKVIGMYNDVLKNIVPS